MQPEEVIKKIILLCQKYSARECVLFGSRAKGSARERSDIDIAVSGVNDFFSMQEEVENLPTLFEIDLVNLDTCSSQLLLEDIKKYGKKIYEQVPIL